MKTETRKTHLTDQIFESYPLNEKLCGELIPNHSSTISLHDRYFKTLDEHDEK